MKKLKFCGFVMIFAILFLVLLNTNIYAAETGAEQGTSIADQVNEFLNKWTTPITSAILGFVGSAFGLLVRFRQWKKLEYQLVTTNKECVDERKALEKDIELAKEEIQNAKNELLDQKNVFSEMFQNLKKDYEGIILQVKEQYETVIESQKENFAKLQETYVEEINTFKEQAIAVVKSGEIIEDFKALIGLLVASSPELANNGYTQKILELLATKGSGDINGTEETNN